MKQTIDFIGIGSEKCGSTWVAQVLAEHPAVLFSSEKTKKELRFFNKPSNFELIKDRNSNWEKGFNWYYQQFPHSQQGKIRGEFSVSYLPDLTAAKRIKKHLPEVKIIVILRNPVGKLFSLFKQAKMSIEIKNPTNFMQFIESAEIMDEVKYYQQLKAYYRLFGRKQIHVILLSEVKTKPQEVAKTLYQFLKIDDSFFPSIIDKPINVSKGTRFPQLQSLLRSILKLIEKLELKSIYQWLIGNSKIYHLYQKINHKPIGQATINKVARKKIIFELQPDIQKLEKLIDKDLSHWLQVD